MAQRLLTPPSSRLFQDTELGNIIRENEPSLIEILNVDTELGNVIRDSEPLLRKVFDEEREFLIVDKNTREVRNVDVEQAVTRVADTVDISDLISIIGGQENDRSSETIGNITDKHLSEEYGKLDEHFSFCMYCTDNKRFETHDQIKRGDSIRFPRKRGLYYHHAIVKEVQKGSNSSQCTLTLIHLKKVGEPILTQVIEETKTYDLREEIVEKVIYKSNRFTPDEIVQRAEKYAAQNTTPRVYNVFANNCEHLTSQFAQGVKISPQVISKSQQLKSGLLWIVNFLYIIASKLLNLPGMASIASVASFYNITGKIKELQKFFRDKIVCFGCYRKKYKKLEKSLVLALISLAFSVINHCNLSTLAINLIISSALPLVGTHIMPLIQPAFVIPKENLSINNIPRAGDIITFIYNNIPREGVVSTVHGIRSDITRLKATIIHFPWPGVFGTYTVTEKTIYFTQIDDVSVLNFEGTYHFPASDVVKRAKEQLGKQNHCHFTYRSSHMSRYCKTGSKNIRTLPKVPVRSMKDLSPGDVIWFRYLGLPHEAVLVKIAEAEEITLNVIHYNYAGIFETREVVNEEMTFKLPDEDVLIHDYANEEVYEPEEVVRRAKSKVGEQKFNVITNRSSHLAKWCKVKQK